MKGIPTTNLFFNIPKPEFLALAVINFNFSIEDKGRDMKENGGMKGDRWQ